MGRFMKFWNDFEEFKKISKFFKLEMHLHLDFKSFISQNKTKKGTYEDFLKSMPYIGTMESFEKKFIYINQYKGKVKEDDIFKDLILELPDFIMGRDNNSCAMLIYFFSITNKKILKENFLEIESVIYKIIDCNNFKNINSLYSIVFSYLFLVFHLNKTFSYGIVSKYVCQYINISSDVWLGFKCENKLNYVIVVSLVHFFLKATKSNYKFFEISNVYDSIIYDNKKIGDKVYSSIFIDLSSEIKKKIFDSFFKKENLYKLLTENDHYKIKNILYKINSYRKPITIESLYDYLYQFEEVERVRAILKILENLNFFTFHQLNEILENILIKQIKSNSKKIYICPLEADGSSSIYQYLASHSDNLKKAYGKKIKFERSINDVLLSSKIEDEIIVIDDCSLSGTQTSNIISELLGIRKLKVHHDVHCEKLEESLLAKFKLSNVNLCFCVGSDYAKKTLEDLICANNLEKFKIYIGKYLHMTDPEDGNSGNRIFESNSLIWESCKEREDLKEFCQRIGYRILGDIAEQKKWDEARRKQSSLGYSDLQQVLVFPYSVPKTTLPILWCEGENWKPLFPNT